LKQICFSYSRTNSIQNGFLHSVIIIEVNIVAEQKQTYSEAYAENFHGGVHSVAYDCHLYLVCAVCDVTILRHVHVSTPTFWRSLL